MKLIKLKLTNFKGIKSFEFIPNGKNVVVEGDNATGKTTLFDAINWLLFDKDSLDRADFGIKTLDENGNVIHQLDHKVEGLFSYNGENISLERIYKEKWSTKRGSAIKKLTTHENEYIINGVPVAAKDYKEYINKNLITADIFKLLTNPLYFNTTLKWQKRRNILMELVGSVDVPESKKERFKNLLARMGKLDTEQYRLALNRQKNALKKELDELPPRIDELNSSLPEVSDDKKILTNIEKLTKQLSECREKQALIKNGDLRIPLLQEIKKIEQEISLLKQRNKIDIENKKNKIVYELDYKRKEIESLKNTVKKVNTTKSNLEQNMQSEADEISKLGDDFTKVDSEQFIEPESFEYCPTCKQKLPQVEIEKLRNKLLGDFNLSKATKKKEIIMKGSVIRDIQEKQANEIMLLEKELEALLKAIKDKEEHIKKLEEEFNNFKEPVWPTKEVTELINQHTMLNDKLNNLDTAKADEIKAIEEVIKNKQSILENLLADKAKLDIAETTKSRINQLNERLRGLGNELSELEMVEFELDDYVTLKVSTVEEAINDKFQFAKFKLFEHQLNGGIRECCEVTMNNIPFKDLNNAARINIGLDIINTLSDHFGVTAPVFIDNAESVTKFIQCKSQTILLTVVKGVSKLTVKEME